MSEPVMAALISDALTLTDVLVSNSRVQTILAMKVDALRKQIEKHNRVIERTYGLKREVAVLKENVRSIKERMR